MLRSQNRNKKIQLAAAATGLKRKQMFECLVLSSIIIKPLSLGMGIVKVLTGLLLLSILLIDPVL